MKVVIKRVSEKPVVAEIENKLEAFKEIVDGYIEVFSFYEPFNIICVCNEEGKLKNAVFNFVYYGDIICGDVFFVSTDGEDFAGLDDDQINVILKMFS